MLKEDLLRARHYSCLRSCTRTLSLGTSRVAEGGGVGGREGRRGKEKAPKRIRKSKGLSAKKKSFRVRKESASVLPDFFFLGAKNS